MNKLTEISPEVAEGTATDTEFSVALKAIQNAMSMTLVQRAGTLERSLARFDRLLDSAIEALTTKLSTQIEAETVDILSLTKFIESVQTKQIAIVDLYRKIVQGNPLFTTDTLSEEEKLVLKLMKSFTTQEQKQKFLQLCKQQLELNE